MEEKRKRREELFRKKLLETKRPGVDKLLEYMNTTDFFSAPATSQYSGAYEGGLLCHSLNVLSLLAKKFKEEKGIWGSIRKKDEISWDSIVLVALLSNLHKIGNYESYEKNVRSYDPEKIQASNPSERKTDAKGTYIWETTCAYQYTDPRPLGKGEKNLVIAMRFLQLTEQEIFALRWVKGFYDSRITADVSKVFEKYPLALALYEADMEATYIVDSMSQ